LSDLERGELGGPANEGFREAYAAAERAAAEEAGLLEAEAPAEAETPVAEETPVVEEKLLAGKYKSVDDLERAYAEAQAVIGRQGSEVSELRQTLEQRLDAIDERVNAPQPVRQQITPDFIEQNPAAAAQLAFEQGDTYTLQAAFEQWKMEDPAGSTAWAVTKQAEEREKNLRADYDARLKEIEAKFSPLSAHNEEQQLQQAVLALPEDTRAFLSNPQTVEALANEFPTLGRQIASGAPADRIEAVRALYDIHRGRVSDTLKQTEQEAARSTAEEAQAIRDEAYVASSTSSQEQPKTLEQQEQEKAVASFTRARNTWDSALVRPAKK
jgi:hypothetical protein